MEGGQPPIKIPTGIWGPLPQNTFGLLLGRSSSTLKGLVVYPGVIDSDYTGEICILASLSQGAITLPPKVPIAQLLLLPFVKTSNPILKKNRGTEGFGSTSVYWTQLISPDKPLLELKVQGISFTGLMDTGADVSVISNGQWPPSWPKQTVQVPIRGVGIASAPEQSTDLLKWIDPSGQEGTFKPFVLDIEVNLWGRDILSQMKVAISSDWATQHLKKFGYVDGKGLGKDLQGIVMPLSISQKKDKKGLGFH